MDKIKIGIVGYGNLGKGAEKAVNLAEDMELVGIFTRRDPKALDTEARVFPIEDLIDFKGKIDVCLLCGGSATDLVGQSPELAENFNIVDSYDNHAKIPLHFSRIDQVARENKTLGIISAGWDPGLFSLMRGLTEAILPKGTTYSFWGSGVSQGHSDAVRRIDGVLRATQYTIPNDQAIEEIKAGQEPKLKLSDRHYRECHVVIEEGASEEEIKDKIINMPDYFKGFDTTVKFMSLEEYEERDCGMPHGGKVMRLGHTSEGQRHLIDLSLKLDSNPEFTSSIMVAYARAVYRLHKEGKTGCMSIYDVAPKYLSLRTEEELRNNLL